MQPVIRVIVREPITSQDMRDIVAIEQSAYLFPRYKAEIFKDGNIVLLADYHGTVAAYMIFRLIRNQLFLENIVVRHDFQRKGIGTQLLQRLIDLIKSVRYGYTDNSQDTVVISDIRKRITRQVCRSISLYVRETNFPALCFFRKFEFTATKVIPNFYDQPGDTNEDAYAMHLNLHHRPVMTDAVTNRIKQFFH